jgi:hypothetical protein
LSEAVSETDTAAVYQPVEHAVLLQATVVAGAVPSMRMSWLRTASAFPAKSQDRYLTVVVLATLNGAEYVGLVSVGSVPSVV